MAPLMRDARPVQENPTAVQLAIFENRFIRVIRFDKNTHDAPDA